MRAFMSDRSERLYHGRGDCRAFIQHRITPELQVMAMREAERILAETEPTRYAEGYGPESRTKSDMRVTVWTREPIPASAWRTGCWPKPWPRFLGDAGEEAGQ